MTYDHYNGDHDCNWTSVYMSKSSIHQATTNLILNFIFLLLSKKLDRKTMHLSVENDKFFAIQREYHE